AGLRILTGRTTSPTLAGQIAALRRKYPSSVWQRWEPINDDNVLSGAETAFGRRLEPRYQLDQADVLASPDADLLGPGPHQVMHALAFAEGRRARSNTRKLTRLYVAEPLLTLTGAMADNRLPLRRTAASEVAQALAVRLGAPLDGPALDPD